MDVTAEELPDTMAAVRLSGMEISDLTMELRDLGLALLSLLLKILGYKSKCLPTIKNFFGLVSIFGMLYEGKFLFFCRQGVVRKNTVNLACLAKLQHMQLSDMCTFYELDLNASLCLFDMVV